MKTALTQLRCRTAALTSLALVVLLLAGCLEEHLIWSPDGSRAAVLAKDGLHFCDAEGKLTPPLLTGVYAVAWLSDGQRVVVARSHVAEGWADVAQALGAERAAQVTVQAAEVWKKLEAGGRWSVLTKESGGKSALAVLAVCLREHYGDALGAKMNAGEWDEMKSARVEINELVTARIEGAVVRPGPVLHEGVEKIEALRVSPGDQAVAFTTGLAPDNDKESRLWVVGVDTAGAKAVAERTAAYPDWTADRRSVVYVQAAAGEANDDLCLGTLIRRGVLDEKGKVAVQKGAEDLAGLMFSKTARVRCLRDGRIMFNAVEFTLPISTKDADVERERLFALDPARQSTLVRMIPRGEEENMPKNLTFFELSPDERRVLVGGYEGEVGVLTIASGEVGRLQKAGDYNLMAAPVWRNNDEITYARRNPAENGKQPARKAEIVLQKISPAKGDHETVLSKDWSADLLESVFSGSDKK
jgi:hypothetical protein